MSTGTEAMMSTAEMSVSRGKRAIFAAFFGFFVDMYDVYLPIVALAPALTYFEPKTLSSEVSLTWFYLSFAASLLGRPIGAFIFGHFGDKVGRRKTTLISVAGFGLTIFVILCLPGYNTWGLWGIGLYTLFRFVDGIFLGGEYTAASPLAMEYAPSAKRGRYGGFINSGYPVALVLMSLVTLGSLRLFPISAPVGYLTWGWRVPFLVGVILAAILFVYYYKSVDESVLWAKSEKLKTPLLHLFSGIHARRLFEVLLVMSGVWFVLYGIVVPLPSVLLTTLKVPANIESAISLVSNVFMFVTFILAGILSDKFGRKRLLITFGVFSAVLGPLFYYLLVSGGYHHAFTLWLYSILAQLFPTSVYGVLTAYITERFPTNIRSAGYGIGYSLAAIIPSFSSFYMLWLSHFMPYQYTEIVLLVLGGILMFIGGFLGPETSGNELPE